MRTHEEPVTAPNERLVGDIELASVLSISRRHVHTLRARGILRAVKLGSSLRFPLHENLAKVLGDTPGNEPKRREGALVTVA